MAGETFGELLMQRMRDKRIEVYLGSSAKTREYADFSVDHKEVIRGVLRDAVGDLMVVEVFDKANNSNLVYVNCWCVTAVLEPQNKISVIDVFCDAAAKQVK